MKKDNPLFSFCILIYNQENLIEEAITAALAQNYSPLEIIISDDCSTDNSWAIAQKVVENYSGPHKIILNRNEKNIGLVQHCNKIFYELSHGDWIVLAAGDDISAPNRCQDIYDAWEKNGFNASVVINGIHILNSQPEIIAQSCNADKFFSRKDFLRSKNFSGAGCASAYHRSLFEKFPPLVTRSLEDRPLHFRGLLCDGIIYTEKTGVFYRITGNNMSVTTNPLLNKRKKYTYILESSAQHYLDLTHAFSKNIISEQEFTDICQAVQKMYNQQMSRNLIIEIPWILRIKYLFSARLNLRSWCINLLELVLPKKICDHLKKVKHLINSSRER